MKKLILFFIGMLLIGCTSSDNTINPSCYQDEDRKVVSALENVEGKIIGPNDQYCPTIFYLRVNSGESTLPLAACNLTEGFKVDGLEVVLSGYLFETFDLEDLCAFPFELTNITKIGLQK